MVQCGTSPLLCFSITVHSSPRFTISSQHERRVGSKRARGTSGGLLVWDIKVPWIFFRFSSCVTCGFVEPTAISFDGLFTDSADSTVSLVETLYWLSLKLPIWMNFLRFFKRPLTPPPSFSEKCAIICFWDFVKYWESSRSLTFLTLLTSASALWTTPIFSLLLLLKLFKLN